MQLYPLINIESFIVFYFIHIILFIFFPFLILYIKYFLLPINSQLFYHSKAFPKQQVLKEKLVRQIVVFPLLASILQCAQFSDLCSFSLSVQKLDCVLKIESTRKRNPPPVAMKNTWPNSKGVEPREQSSKPPAVPISSQTPQPDHVHRHRKTLWPLSLPQGWMHRRHCASLWMWSTASSRWGTKSWRPSNWPTP